MVLSTSSTVLIGAMGWFYGPNRPYGPYGPNRPGASLVYVMLAVPESSRVMSRRFYGVRFKFQCGSFNVERGLVSSPCFAHIHVTVNMSTVALKFETIRFSGLCIGRRRYYH